MIPGRSRLVAIWASAALWLTSSAALAAAPTELYNKTVELSWTVESVQRLPDGRTVTPSVHVERQIYVSSAGRLFARTTRSSLRRGALITKSGEVAPGDDRTPGGLARQFRFEGHHLVSRAEYHSGAAQMTVDFGADFRTCAMNLVYGRQGGAPIKWKAMDGTIREVISARAVSSSCSIRNGNPFAGE
jgi:hypothetical protein